MSDNIGDESVDSTEERGVTDTLDNTENVSTYGAENGEKLDSEGVEYTEGNDIVDTSTGELQEDQDAEDEGELSNADISEREGDEQDVEPEGESDGEDEELKEEKIDDNEESKEEKLDDNEEGDEDDTKPMDEKDELTKQIFGDSDEEEEDAPEPVDYKESEDDEEFTDNTKKLKRLAKNSKRKKKEQTEQNESGEDDEDGEDEEATKPAKKHKKGKGSKKKGDTPKKRRLSAAGDSGDDQSDSERTKAPKDSDVPELDAALERIKKKRPKTIGDDKLEPLLRILMDKMDMAAADDIKANKAREPAINKIRLLKEVTETLNKAPYMKKFLELEGLQSIKKWLEPMPDKSLPNIKIREQLLAVLAIMPIELEHLKTSEVGKVVMFLHHNSTESRDNKRLCAALIEKWSRPIFNLSSKYEDLAKIEKSKTSRRQQVEEEESGLDRLTKEQTKDTRKHHAAIPKRLAMDYVVRPRKEDCKSDTLKVKNLPLLAASADKRIKQKLTKGRNPAGRKVLRAEKISIEGRGYK